MAFQKNETHFNLARVKHELRASGVRGESPNPLTTGIHTRGYLPHIKKEGAWYFVTFRLADSLPQKVLLEFERLHAEKVRLLNSAEIKTRQELDRELRREIERYLDRGVGKCFLRDERIAGLVEESLLYFDGRDYLLGEWVIMPNHVHLIIWPMPNHTLSDILQSRKARTARAANQLLNMTGIRFWQPESYDHWIRDDEEMARIRRYIQNNPVKAKLSSTPEEWRWSSASRRQMK